MDDGEKRAPPVLPPATGVPAINTGRDFHETAGSDLVYTESLRASENLLPSNASAPPVQQKKKGKAATRELRVQEIGIEAMDFFEKEQAEFHAESLEIIELTGRGEARLYLFLQRCFEFVQDERFDLAKFEIFCRFKKLTCTKATKKNQYLCAIRANAPDIKTTEASKYATALQWIKRQPLGDRTVVQVIKAEGGIEKCAQKERKAKYREDRSPPAPTVRRLAINGIPNDLTGTVSLVVRIEGSKTVLISHAMLDPEGILLENSRESEDSATLSATTEPSNDDAGDQEEASSEAEEVMQHT